MGRGDAPRSLAPACKDPRRRTHLVRGQRLLEPHDYQGKCFVWRGARRAPPLLLGLEWPEGTRGGGE